MKKFAFLAVVLALSTVAMGVPKIDVQACPPSPDCGDCVKLMICGCAPGYYYVSGINLEACCGEQYLILDVYMKKGCGPCIDQPFWESYTLGKMCPGMYMVAVKLHLEDYAPCTDVVAMDSTFFTVKSCGCGSGSLLWWPF